MKIKVKELTSRSNGMGNELRATKLRRYIMGDLDSYSFQSIIDKLQRELRNRRVPNGTHGGVGGRLLK